jgi:26S proteasome regulatory subunit N10
MEATVVCVDNSEWTRNGDYAPTRFQAQADAVNLLAGAKTEANPENTVGVLTMAGKSPRVLVTPTPDLGKILNSMQVGSTYTYDTLRLKMTVERLFYHPSYSEL